MSNLLELKNLYVEYKTQNGFMREEQTIHAVNGVSLELKRGETLAIAGESGCGKSTLAKALIDLVPTKSGKILYYGQDISRLKRRGMKEYRRNIQMIFQNPYSSLNPKMKIGEILKEPLVVNGMAKDADKKVEEVVKKVGMDRECLNLYPHEFSGGQRQRIAIARALILEPEIILADEPVSALDVSIQAQIINLLLDLKEHYNLTIILISHDMGVIRSLADRVAIMYLGQIVEIGSNFDIFNTPKHPYTEALLNAVPQLNKKRNLTNILQGDLPSPSNLPLGCKFHTRCKYCMNECMLHEPLAKKLSSSHYVSCFLYSNF